MSEALDRYWSLLDALRAQRRLPTWRVERDRELLERIDDVFGELDDAESELARAGTWRGSPEKFDERMETAMFDTAEPDRGATHEAPRHVPEAA